MRLILLTAPARFPPCPCPPPDTEAAPHNWNIRTYAGINRLLGRMIPAKEMGEQLAETEKTECLNDINRAAVIRWLPCVRYAFAFVDPN